MQQFIMMYHVCNWNCKALPSAQLKVMFLELKYWLCQLEDASWYLVNFLSKKTLKIPIHFYFEENNVNCTVKIDISASIFLHQFHQLRLTIRNKANFKLLFLPQFQLKKFVKITGQCCQQLFVFWTAIGLKTK